MTDVPCRPMYLDCNTGIDDALALAYLLASPQIALLGIGTVSSNTDASKAARNTQGLLTLAGRAETGPGDRPTHRADDLTAEVRACRTSS